MTKVTVKNSRSLLFVKRQCFERIMDFDCDVIIFDLQDSVPAEHKRATRQELVRVLTDNTLVLEKPIFLRVNELSNEAELMEDLDCCITPNITGLILPLLEHADDILQFSKLIDRIEQNQGLPKDHYKFICLLETPLSIQNAFEIAAASSRNIALSFGHGDFLNLMVGEKCLESLLYAKSRIAIAGRANNLLVIDSPYMELNDASGFIEECELAKKMGFSGKYLIHQKQIFTANRVFSANTIDIKTAEKLLKGNDKGCFVKHNTMMGPPFIKRLQKSLEQGSYSYQPRQAFKGVMAQAIQYGLDVSDVYIGKVIHVPYELTITESWMVLWKSFHFSANAIENSLPYCNKHGLSAIPVPYTFVLALALCLSVEVFTENSLLHLEANRARYHKNTYPGDTLSSYIKIIDICYTSNDQNTIIESLHVVVNQHQEEVFSVLKKTLFPFKIATSQSATTADTNAPISFDLLQRFPSVLASTYVAADNLIQARTLYCHPCVRTVNDSESNFFNSLFHNTHPVHSNRLRYGKSKLVLCGLQILPIILGISDRDFREVLSQEIVKCVHINKVNPGDNLAAISYVHSINNDNDSYQVVEVITLGLKNIDPQQLLDVNFPIDLFTLDIQRSAYYENICNNLISLLNNSIVLVCHRKLITYLSNKGHSHSFIQAEKSEVV